MKQIIIALLFISPALATERNKREFVPIIPKGETVTSQPRESANKALPEHDPNRVYHGPDASLFPAIKFTGPKIEFAK